MRRRVHDKTLRQIAAALDVDPDQLQYFRECHPDPTVDVVLNLADRPPVDDDTRELVAEWLADDSNGERDGDNPGGAPRGLVFHRGGDLKQ
jgi:hypothetical protein